MSTECFPVRFKDEQASETMGRHTPISTIGRWCPEPQQQQVSNAVESTLASSLLIQQLNQIEQRHIRVCTCVYITVILREGVNEKKI